MATAKRFEDLEVWQRARELNRLIYALTRDGAFARDFALRDQIRRASISIMSNIAEGFDRNGDCEFAQFLSIAKASVAEVKSQLYAALDADHLNQHQFDQAYNLADEVIRMTTTLMIYLRNSPNQGAKFR